MAQVRELHGTGKTNMLEIDRPAPDTREGALHIVYSGDKLVMDLRSPKPCLLQHSDVKASPWDIVSEQFVGFWQGEPCFAVEAATPADVDPMRFQLGSLYQLLGRVDDALFALAGRALQLLAWERDHQFCGRCGGPMQQAPQERAMQCARCNIPLYPRIAPCVITLVTKGPLMLLARNARFPRPMYSTLAGFIEAGESAEDTLRREVREEVGVEVAKLSYFDSQPWPFPSQLMLGYFAQYASGEITPDMDEIAEADWYHPSDLPPVPPPASIAGRLIQHHCKLHA